MDDEHKLVATSGKRAQNGEERESKNAEMGEGVVIATDEEKSEKPKVHEAKRNEYKMMNQVEDGEHEMLALVGKGTMEKVAVEDEVRMDEDVEENGSEEIEMNEAKKGEHEKFAREECECAVEKGKAEVEVLMVEDAKEGEYKMFASDEAEIEEPVAKDAKKKKENKYEGFGRRMMEAGGEVVCRGVGARGE